jgi:hypothetical protein
MKIPTEIIDFFGMAPTVSSNNDRLDFAELNQIAVKKGYLIHPDCCSTYVRDWLSSLTSDYNSTFYREWNEVISRNHFELFVDQILHYATTYGTDFQVGNGYVPNGGSDIPQYTKLKVIRPINMGDLYLRCVNTLVNGVALSEKTMEAMVSVVVEYTKEKNIEITPKFLSNVKNREAQAALSSYLGIFPDDEISILRVIVYKITGSAILIKDRKTEGELRKCSDSLSPLGNLTEAEMVKLSRIFHRFKPLFMSMKVGRKTNHVVNRIRKLADRNHNPMEAGYWETLLSNRKNYQKIEQRLPELDTFRKVRLLQAVNTALFSASTDSVYVIRNGKVHVRLGYRPKYDTEYLKLLKGLLESSVVEDLKPKACRVRFPRFFSLTVPSSEKSFVGNYPFGTSVELGHSSVFGIYWRNEWNGKNHTDYDLSFITAGNSKIGWNSEYYNWNNSIIYSGDMTNANPEATELFYVNRLCPSGIVKVNKYSGYSGSDKGKFRFFVAVDNSVDVKKLMNHMVDPNNVILDTMTESNGCRNEMSLGVVHNNRLYLMSLNSGNRLVSYGDERSSAFLTTMLESSKCFVNLKEILLRAGFVEDDENPELDLEDVKKDTLLNLLKKDNIKKGNIK